MKKAVVVGSGAGGCAAAKQLSGSFDVTVVEAGNGFVPFKYDTARFEPLRRRGLFLDERMISALFPAMRVLKARGGLVHVNGCCIGGTTQLATGNAIRCDGLLRDIGIDLSTEFAELENEVPQTREHIRAWSDLTVLLYSIFEDMGLDPQITPKFMHDAKKCATCGKCVLGCRFGAKWTADALLEDNPRIGYMASTEALSLVIHDGLVFAVVVKNLLGREQIVPADVVVLAAGGLGTPVILNASGIPTDPSLFVDPVICVAAPLEGARLDAQLPMPFVSQRDGYILSPYFDWLSFFFNNDWRMPAHDIASIMVKFADSSEGSFDGKRLHKRLTSHDEAIVERSVEESKQILERLGVRREDMFLGTLNAGHPGGCLPLSEAEAETFHHDSLPANLYVADASLFPHSMGNPPMLTIMALAKRVAKMCAQNFA